MDVAARLNEYALKLEPELERFMPSMQLPQGEVFQACRYSLLNAGKRMRPALLLEFNRLSGGDEKEALPFACAIEMIHTYSLIHDDLPCMDDDDLRRGKPSCHKQFSEAIAVLAGDALLTRAFEIMLGTQTGVDASACMKAAAHMACMSGVFGMIGGQVIDIAPSEDVSRHMNMVRLKTGALLNAACVCGCLIQRADTRMVKAAEAYADALGLAFQLRDDMLDVIGDESVLGKKTGNDIKNHKYTFIEAYGLHGCEKMLMELTQKAQDAVSWIEGSEFLAGLAAWNIERLS